MKIDRPSLNRLKRVALVIAVPWDLYFGSIFLLAVAITGNSPKQSDIQAAFLVLVVEPTILVAIVWGIWEYLANRGYVGNGKRIADIFKFKKGK